MKDINFVLYYSFVFVKQGEDGLLGFVCSKEYWFVCD